VLLIKFGLIVSHIVFGHVFRILPQSMAVTYLSKLVLRVQSRRNGKLERECDVNSKLEFGLGHGVEASVFTTDFFSDGDCMWSNAQRLLLERDPKVRQL